MARPSLVSKRLLFPEFFLSVHIDRRTISGMNQSASPRQAIFLDAVLGTLIYAVVLGFFNDYTDILATTSFSTTFMLAFVMHVLTWLTLRLKKFLASSVRQRVTRFKNVVLGLSIWFVMFSSKFVFLAVIERLFADSVQIAGFFGIMAIVLAMIISQRAFEWIYQALGD